MKNKTVGYIIIAIGMLIGLIIYLFNRALTDIVQTTCSHGPTCTMWTSIDYQTYTSAILMGIIILIGLYLIFLSKEQETNKIQQKREQTKKKKQEKTKNKIDENIYQKLTEEEKIVIDIVANSKDIIYQSNIVKQTQFSKVKITRILDKLENKHLIERKRRGMTNLVVLK